MVKCVYCGREAVPIQGIHYITNDGVVQFFCSSKCRKNSLKLKRDKRKLKWTEAYRVALGKSRAAEVRDKAAAAALATAPAPEPKKSTKKK